MITRGYGIQGGGGAGETVFVDGITATLLDDPTVTADGDLLAVVEEPIEVEAEPSPDVETSPDIDVEVC